MRKKRNLSQVMIRAEIIKIDLKSEVENLKKHLPENATHMRLAGRMPCKGAWGLRVGRCSF